MEALSGRVVNRRKSSIWQRVYAEVMIDAWNAAALLEIPTVWPAKLTIQAVLAISLGCGGVRSEKRY